MSDKYESFIGLGLAAPILDQYKKVAQDPDKVFETKKTTEEIEFDMWQKQKRNELEVQISKDREKLNEKIKKRRKKTEELESKMVKCDACGDEYNSKDGVSKKCTTYYCGHFYGGCGETTVSYRHRCNRCLGIRDWKEERKEYDKMKNEFDRMKEEYEKMKCKNEQLEKASKTHLGEKTRVIKLYEKFQEENEALQEQVNLMKKDCEVFEKVKNAFEILNDHIYDDEEKESEGEDKK